MKHARADYDRFQDPAGIIPEDEPVFLIRGQDVVAPEVLRTWIREARLVGAKPDIIAAVTAHAKAMEDWQRRVARKVPDLPAVSGAQTFYDRLLAEQKELRERTEKLRTFIDSSAFRDLDEQQRELLVGQHEAMRVYSDILGERIRTIAPPESRSTARHSDKPDEIIGEGVRMIGGDQSEKPVPFTG